MWNWNTFYSVEFLNEDYVVGGIYRHPNGNTAHFIDDLETAIGKLKDNVTVILAGDINIDIIKFEKEQTMAYLTTLLSNRFLPFITLPTRIQDLSATCNDHIFVKPGGHVKQNIKEIYSGIFHCDISDHLPCFLSFKGKNCSNIPDKRREYLAIKIVENSLTWWNPWTGMICLPKIQIGILNLSKLWGRSLKINFQLFKFPASEWKLILGLQRAWKLAYKHFIDYINKLLLMSIYTRKGRTRNIKTYYENVLE